MIRCSAWPSAGMHGTEPLRPRVPGSACPLPATAFDRLGSTPTHLTGSPRAELATRGSHSPPALAAPFGTTAARQKTNCALHRPRRIRSRPVRPPAPPPLPVCTRLRQNHGRKPVAFHSSIEPGNFPNPPAFEACALLDGQVRSVAGKPAFQNVQLPFAPRNLLLEITRCGSTFQAAIRLGGLLFPEPLGTFFTMHRDGFGVKLFFEFQSAFPQLVSSMPSDSCG